MTKMTKKDYFTALKGIDEVAANAQLVEFIDKELALLAKKNASRSTEMTATQKENAQMAEDIMAWIADRTVTVAEVRKHFGISSQKATPILNGLEKAGRLTKTVDKRVSYFSAIVEG